MSEDFDVKECFLEMEAIADGLYEGVIRKVEITPLENGGDVITITIVLDYKGITREVVKKYHVISKQAQQFFIKEMKRLGLQVMKRQDLLDGQNSLVGVKAKFKAVTNSESFQCWYVVEKIDENTEAVPAFVW